MRLLPLVVACSLAVATATPARAELVEVGLMPMAGGLVGVQAGPWPVSLRAQAWTIGLLSWVGQSDVMLQTTPLVPTPQPAFGLVGGVDWAFSSGNRCISFGGGDNGEPVTTACQASRPLRYFAGLVYQQSWNWLWWRVTPTFGFGPSTVSNPLNPSNPADEAFKDQIALPPLVEVGVRTGGVSFSVRGNLPVFVLGFAF